VTQIMWYLTSQTECAFLRYSAIIAQSSTDAEAHRLKAVGLDRVIELNDADPESRDLAADTIGYLLGYSQLTNTRSLALIGDPELMAYKILFSFSSPAEKARFLDFIRSNDQLGNEYIVNDLIEPVKEEIRDAQPLAAVLPQSALARALMVATFVSGPIQPSTIQ
ncbi:MAG TPA: hypothetical protein VHX20_09300, partial [Terracidiphilus sp.]|nr:hypothetical protein [Terracidiphilus sp.]